MTPEQKEDLDHALLAYWTKRDEARIAQAARRDAEPGERAGVTAGLHLDRIAQLLGRVCIAAGAPPAAVYYKTPKGDPHWRKGISTGFTLPGYYRPTKQWDLVVNFQKNPIVAVELKSQNGPSYGNNANNRVEEAIGNAVDLAKACEAGLLPTRPWMGYVYVIEDDWISKKDERGKVDTSFLDKDPIFTNWSYIDRMRLLCQRLVEDKFYDSTWAVATSRPSCAAGETANLKTLREKCAQFKKGAPSGHRHNFNWHEPDPATSGYVQFITALTAKIGEFYPSADSSGTPEISLHSQLELPPD